MPATANIATNTQNELTSPAIAKAPAPRMSPQMMTMRALTRSTRKPVGICIAVDSTLKAVSASPSSV
jgi:hypothetical protein